MPLGKVKWFNSKKGYGFITDDETEKDIFLHVSALEESKLRILKEDQKLEFEIKKDRNVSLSLANNQITEIKGSEMKVGTGYTWRKLQLPFKFSF